MEVASEALALAERLRSIGISESYASQLANRRRAPSLVLALKIHREIGIQLGPVEGASSAEIEALEKMTARQAGHGAAA